MAIKTVDKEYAGPIIALLLLIMVVFLEINVSGLLFTLMVNGIVGVVLLVILNFLPFIDIKINVWSVIICALGGIAGVIILVILDLVGVKV